MHSAICHRLLWSNGSFLLRENTPVIPPGELVEAQGPTFKVQRPKVIAGWRSFKVTQKTNTVDHQQLHDTRQYCLVHMFYGWLGTRSNGGVLPDLFLLRDSQLPDSNPARIFRVFGSQEFRRLCKNTATVVSAAGRVCIAQSRGRR